MVLFVHDIHLPLKFINNKPPQPQQLINVCLVYFRSMQTENTLTQNTKLNYKTTILLC